MSGDNLTREEARERARLLSDVAYDVHLDLTRDDGFSSETVVRFSCAAPGAATFIDLLANEVVAAELNGVALPAGAFDGSRLELPGLEERNELRVRAAIAYQHTGYGLHRFVDPVDGRPYLHTQFEPFDAHRVYACFDQPDLKAPFTLTVDAPAAWEVVSNGVAVERPGAGDAGTWRFAPTLPISPYITALVAGPYHRVTDAHESIDLGLYCRQSLAEHLEPGEMFEVTKQGFAFFQRYFDYPYPFGKYDQLFVPEFNAGAMENAGCVTFSEAYLFRSKVTEAARQNRANTILHEMAHMWFGDLVTMRWWDDLWLNESFATYMAYVALVEATRFREAWANFAYSNKAWAYQQDQLPSTHPIVADIVDTAAVRVNFDGITYAKGASVLRQLVAWVGEDAFRDGLRGYFREHEFANAQLGDFLAALERGSGRDLGDWSKQWLETAGVNTMRPDAAVDGGRFTSFAVVQEATADHPTLRDHRIGVGLYDRTDDGLQRRDLVELDVVGARTPVPALEGAPAPDLLLLNDGDLTYTKVRLDARSLATLEADLGVLRDPLARTLCWGAGWDMTRDGELPARRWAALVGRHAAGESDPGVLQTLLAQAEAALDRFGDPANRLPARRELAAAVRRELDAAEPGSDRQLLWARSYASLADDPDALGFVGGLLDGTASVPGLAIDTDVRWHLVTALASAGAADDALIDAEAQRDPTDLGARRAATARAVRPRAEAKAAAWDAAVEDRTLPLAMLRALLPAFSQPAQHELLASYVERYVEVLPRIWAERSVEEALMLTSGLFPSGLVDEAAVDAAERALQLDLPRPALRLISEGADSVRRALRARARDRAEA